MSDSSIIFIFPYHKISGVPVLFLRMARIFSKNLGIKVAIVDYPDGYMARTLKPEEDVQLIPLRQGESLPLGPDAVLVMQSILPYTMHPDLKIHPDTRILFWTLHPFNWIQTIIPLPYFRDLQGRSFLFQRLANCCITPKLTRRLKLLVENLHRKHSLLFMDGTNLKITTERLKAVIDDPIFVSVPCETLSLNSVAQKNHQRGEILRVAWLGRLSDFKIHILCYSIKTLSALAARQKIKIEMNIIGEGPDSFMLDTLKVTNDFFILKHQGVLVGKILDQFLIDHIDMMMAMGTSALEAARLGLPTILLDMAYGPIVGDYVFRWLYQSHQLSLGEVLDKSRMEKGNHSLEDRLTELENDYASLSRKSYDYVMQHHSIDVVAEQLSEAIQNCQFRYGDIPESLLKKGVIRRSYEFARRLCA